MAFEYNWWDQVWDTFSGEGTSEGAKRREKEWGVAPAQQAASRAEKQRGVVEQGWTDLAARNQKYIDQNQIYNPDGTKREGEPILDYDGNILGYKPIENGFWSKVRSGQSDIRSTFDNQQHGLSGVLAGRGMMGSGQETASRAALAGGQARTLADFETGRVGQQEALLRGLEGRQQDIMSGQTAQAAQFYGSDIGQANAALERERADAAAMWSGVGDLAKAGGYIAGAALTGNPMRLAGAIPSGVNPGLQVSMDGDIAPPMGEPINFMPQGQAGVPASQWPTLSSGPSGPSQLSAANPPPAVPAPSPWYASVGQPYYRNPASPEPPWRVTR